MAVTRRAVGTTNHTTGTNSAASPVVVTGADITLAAGDTVAVVELVYASAGSAGTTMAAAVTCGGVSMTSASGSKVVGSGGTDQDGWSEVFTLSDPITAIGSTGLKAISVSLTFTTDPGGIRCITIPTVLIGAIGTITGGHATSTNLASSMTSGSLTVGTGGYGSAICGNGSAAPGITAGTSIAAITGSVNTGSDNATAADITANGPITFSTNNGDESQLSYITITAAASGVVAPAHNLVFTNLDTAYNW